MESVWEYASGSWGRVALRATSIGAWIEWNRNSTYIRSEGINRDFGIYNSPDELLKKHHQEMAKGKAFLYRHLGRHLMNRNVKRIRDMNL